MRPLFLTCMSLAVFALPQVPASAESGSAGGSLGKSGKSVTGGGGAGKPATPSAPSPAAGGIAGRWYLSFQCSSGPSTVTATIRQVSATAFTGTTIGHTTGYSTEIYEGKVAGASFSWSRRTTNKVTGVVSRATGSLKGSRMEGSEQGPLWSCTFTGSRK